MGFGIPPPICWSTPTNPKLLSICMPSFIKSFLGRLPQGVPPDLHARRRCREDDAEKTTFMTPEGIFCYLVMVFGLKNSGATYTRMVAKVFRAVLGRTMEAYVDDMIVKSKQSTTHADDLREIFEIVKKFQLRLNPKKCTFGVQGGKKPVAYGVTFRDSKGNEHTSFLNGGLKNEIILSAGALGSPQLLMLSGIGPSNQLKAQGINVILDQPMVGQGMSDNPMNGVLIPTATPVETSLVQIVGITEFGSYIETASGLYLAPNAALANSLRGSFGDDLFKGMKVEAGIILGKVKGPFSKGHLELKSKDPNENPTVTFNYFKDPRDLERCVNGMQVIKNLVESRALSSFQYSFTSFESLVDLVATIPFNMRPRLFMTSPAYHSMEQYCIDTVMTLWHYHGGCEVNKVVDRDYKVMGVDALRVIDGSTLSVSPGTNPQATLMMLGRYMGQKVLQQRTSQ
ncbi:unnamed protein product [Cuscuta europaea]|nr:unnamed protein product [Cuscuta europaea]